jgi:hypothetical protein
MKNDVRDLLARYVEAASLHGEATLEGDSQTANKQFDILYNVFMDIKSLGKQGRDGLLTLFEHPNPSVRCWAATHSLIYKERLAKRVLKKIQNSEANIIGFNAEMVLQEWQRGNLNYG